MLEQWLEERRIYAEDQAYLAENREHSNGSQRTGGPDVNNWIVTYSGLMIHGKIGEAERFDHTVEVGSYTEWNPIICESDLAQQRD